MGFLQFELFLRYSREGGSRGFRGKLSPCPPVDETLVNVETLKTCELVKSNITYVGVIIGCNMPWLKLCHCSIYTSHVKVFKAEHEQKLAQEWCIELVLNFISQEIVPMYSGYH